MKRILSLIMCCVFLMISFSQNIIAEGISKTANSKEFELINQLGILPKSVLEKHETGESITRGEYASILYNILTFSSRNNTTDKEVWWEEVYGEYDINNPIKMQATNMLFDDVDSNIEYYNEIAWVTTLGYLTTAGNEFKPDDAIIYVDILNEALKMLGVGRFVNYAGGYPDGVLKYGEDYGLYLKNATEEVNVADVCKLFYSMLDKPVTEGIFENGNFGYNETEVLFVENQLGLKEYKGVLLNDGVISLGEKKADIVIGNKTFSSELDLEDYLGKKVVAYVSIDGENKDTIFAMEEARGNIIVEIDANDIIEYKNDKLNYYKEGRKKSITINDNTILVYNGHLKENWNEDVFDFTNGTIRIIDNGTTSDVAIIESYQSIFVSEFNKEDNIIYNKAQDKILNNGDDKFDLSKAIDEQKIIIRNNMGEKAEINDIKAGIVIDIILNDDYAKLILTDNSETGVSINTIKNSSDDEKGCFEIADEKTYYVLDNVLNSMYGPKIETGKEYTLYFNRNGMVIWIEAEIKNEMLVGYFIKGYMDDAEENYTIKLLDEKGAVVRIETCDKVSYVDENGIKDRTVPDRLKNRMSSFEGIFSYSLTEDGKIKAIEIPQKDHQSDDRLKLLYDSNGAGVGYVAGGFHNEFFVQGTVNVFFVPGTADSKGIDSNYRVGSTSEFRSNTKYDVSGYTRKYGSRLAQYIVCKEGTVGATDQISIRDVKNCILVENIYDSLNEEGEVCKYVTGHTLTTWDTASVAFEGYAPYDITDSKGNTVTAFDVAVDLPNSKNENGTENLYKIQKGDIIRVSTKPNTNIVQKAELVYGINRQNPDFPTGKKGWFAGTTSYINQTGVDSKGEPVYETNYTNPYNHTYYSSITPTVPKKWASGRRIYTGFVYDLCDNILELTTKDLSVSPNYDRESENYYTEWRPVLKKVNVITVSNNEYSLKLGGESDIKTYKTAGAKCSRIIAASVGSKDQLMVIINE